MARFQRGSLRVESRSKGDTWVLRYFITRPFDGRRVEHKLPVGLVRDFPTEHSAWEEVQRQHLHLQINKTDFKGLWVLKTARIPVLKLGSATFSIVDWRESHNERCPLQTKAQRAHFCR